MKSYICGILLIVCAATAFAAVSLGQFNDPRNPGKCTITQNLVLSPGQTIKDPNSDCGRIICKKGGWAEFQSCGVQSVQGCEFGDYINKSLPYPDCCKRHIICK